jgi:membrane protease YdiL (CAAX protease family)
MYPSVKNMNLKKAGAPLAMLVLSVGGWSGLAVCAEVPATASQGGSEFREGGYKDLVKRVEASQSATYATILQTFNDYLRANEDDAVASVEKCRFIEHFAFSDDLTIESSEKDLEACKSDLDQVPVANSEVAQLYQCEGEWGTAGAHLCETVLREALAKPKPWTAAHLTALHEHLYHLYRAQNGESARAGEHAWAAVRLDPASKLRLAAAEYLVQTGAKGQAAALLEPAEPVEWSESELERVTSLLMSLGRTKAARALIDRQSATVESERVRVRLAVLLAQAGDPVAARKLLVPPRTVGATSSPTPIDTLRERFHFERDYGNRNTASAAYRQLRKRGWSADPIGRERLSLLLKYPTAAVDGADMLGILTLLATLGFCALLPLLVIAPVHYRSLVKQVRGVPPGQSAPWGLGELWYALAAITIASLISLYLFDYAGLLAAFRSRNTLSLAPGEVATGADLARALILDTALSLLALLPLVRSSRQRQCVRGAWSVRKSLLAGFAASVVLLMAVGMVRGLAHAMGLGTVAASAATTNRMIQGALTHYGVLPTILVVCVAVPIVEEIVFRGVFLQSAAARIGFWTAAVAQAATFAALHESLGVMPTIFALAMVAAWLARRSGGLLAPMMLHGTNNIVFVLAMRSAAQALHGGL